MLGINRLLLITHIAAGVVSLLLFWLPIITQKGGINHRRTGTLYSKAMYLAIGTGAVLAIGNILLPQTFKPTLFDTTMSTQAVYEIEWQLRRFWAFILYLGLFTWLLIKHGNAVLHSKTHNVLNTWTYLLPIVVVLLLGIGIFAIGVAYERWLSMIFGILGISIALGQLRFCLRGNSTKRERIVEHIGAMIGSGIGAHTAFLTFGARSMLQLEGYWQLAVWIAPGVMGGLAIYYASKPYEQKRKAC
ncbi:hypothetical protein DRW07_01475 [Alteromonas sediminis]|uniref:DUF2306 domain-containing protein n=1 Tax=Alteromonas sediminis TaxID=2259342 RepID=A0A3N5Y3Y7_9ALTE|nr:hypothetical protein [Alteromonas sediminis]RPJ68110.1 hypothetical protein DRW07_01475 [Alteromonas sediminis]